jgi:hypothetical protein
VNGRNGDEFSTETEDIRYAYPAYTAASLDADYQVVAWSGIGIISRWVEPTADVPCTDILMPELYRYTDLATDHCLGRTPVRWNFGDFRPQTVVIYLGTNDASYTRSIPERCDFFSAAYRKFLLFVRQQNPAAYIICIMGSITQELCETERTAVSRFSAETGDRRICFLPLPLQDPTDGIGTAGHPSAVTQQKIAAQLVTFIRAHENKESGEIV